MECQQENYNVDWDYPGSRDYGRAGTIRMVHQVGQVLTVGVALNPVSRMEVALANASVLFTVAEAGLTRDPSPFVGPVVVTQATNWLSRNGVPNVWAMRIGTAIDLVIGSGK